MKYKHILKFFILLIPLLLLWLPDIAPATANEPFRIAVVSFDTKFLTAQRGLADGLKQMGYNDEQLHYAIYDLKKDLQLVPGIVKKLQQQQYDLILTTTTPVVLAVKEAMEKSDPIPVLFTMVADPIGSKVVSSLQSPGGFITGISYNAFTMLPKRLELFQEAFPDMQTIAIFYNQDETWLTRPLQKFFFPVAKNLGFQVVSYNVHDKESMVAATSQLDPNIEGLFMVPDPLAISLFEELLKTSRTHKLPIMVLDNMLLSKGGIMGYSPSFYLIGTQAATMAARILSGIAPGKLAIQNPLETRLVISMKEAALLGLKPSDNILMQSDEILR